MKILKRLGSIITNNFGLKLLSIALAFVLWVLVAQISNPVGTVSFSNVRVTFLNADLLESQGKVFQILDQTDVAKVTVRAPESVISTLSASDITAVADFAEITEDELFSYFEDKPEKLFKILQLLSTRLRQTTERYIDVCRTIYENEEAEASGEEKCPSLLEHLGIYYDYYHMKMMV